MTLTMKWYGSASPRVGAAGAAREDMLRDMAWQLHGPPKRPPKKLRCGGRVRELGAK